MELVLYQTLEDRSNPDHIEQYGPFPCRNKTAWLGYGYYFWDAHIDLGHWWGESCCYDSYVICRANGIYDQFCWDLYGNGLHVIEFEDVCNEIVNKGLCDWDELLVPYVIEFFKKNYKFPYNSIRALGMYSYVNNIYRMKFNLRNKSYLDMRPAVQFCLLNRKALSLQDYKIVYPPDYTENYA